MVKEFEVIFKKYSSKNFQIKSSDYQESGKYPVVDQGKQKIVGFTDNYMKVFKCPKAGVIIFGDHTRELKYVNFDFVVGADGTQLLGTEKGYIELFFFYLLSVKKIPNTGYNRHYKFLQEMEFYTPKPEEQTRIAQILTDMDTEIEALEKKLEKFKMIKQGMMQNLLTGKIRLV